MLFFFPLSAFTHNEKELINTRIQTSTYMTCINKFIVDFRFNFVRSLCFQSLKTLSPNAFVKHCFCKINKFNIRIIILLYIQIRKQKHRRELYVRRLYHIYTRSILNWPVIRPDIRHSPSVIANWIHTQTIIVSYTVPWMRMQLI